MFTKVDSISELMIQKQLRKDTRMTEKIVLPVHHAHQLLDAGIGGTLVNGELTVTVVADQDEGTGRWESIHGLVIQRESDGLYFAADYRRGLTEHQDSQPWEYEKQVTFELVVPVARTVTEYLTPEAAERRAASA